MSDSTRTYSGSAECPLPADDRIGPLAIEQVDDGIWKIPVLLSRGECIALLEWSERAGYAPADVGFPEGGAYRPEIRDNARVIVDQTQLAATLWQRIEDIVPADEHGVRATGLNPRFRFYRYSGKQRFKFHRDGSFATESEISKLTMLVYLNEDFEGGETRFKTMSLKPETGSAVLFVHRLWHEGSAPKSGTKYVMRSDVMYPQAGA